MVSRRQALACGLTDEAIVANLTAARWRRVLRGVYSTTTGPLTRIAVMWAVLLRLGPGAALSHQSAAELHGLGERATRIHVTVPADRRRTALRGVSIHRSSRLDRARHPSRTPPQTTIEETVVDLTQSAATVGAAASARPATGRAAAPPGRVGSGRV